MTFKINGTEFLIPPSRFKWVPRYQLGTNGHGNIVYSTPREFELEWELVTPAMFNQLQGFYNLVGNTGTVVVDLPTQGLATYTFFAYTGCIINEPEMGEFFNQHQGSIRLLVSNIIT